MFLGLDWSDIADEKLREMARTLREEILTGVVVTGGSGGDSSFSGQTTLHPVVRYNMILREMIRRGLTDVPKPITRTRGVFRDPIAPF